MVVGRESIRVLHWNVHSWRSDKDASNADEVISLARELGPDIISLVEVDESWGRRQDVESVARAVGHASIFVPSFEYGSANEPIGGFGNALLARHAIVNVRYRSLVWPPPVYDGSEPSEQRSLTLARLTITNEVAIWIGACHLPRSNGEARLNATRIALQEMESLELPWLLVGDFNQSSESLIGPSDNLKTTPNNVATHPTDRPVERIDYGVFPAGVTVQSEVLSVTGSDHLPVVFDMSIG